MEFHRRINVAKCRQLLKERGYKKELSDEVIQQILDVFYLVAEIQVEEENRILAELVSKSK